MVVHLLAMLCVAAPPAWVRDAGKDPRYPEARYVTGFASAMGVGAVERAKNDAAADLSRKIEVRIESDMRDVTAEKDGAQSYAIASYTRASTDLRISGLKLETFDAGGGAYAFAVLEKAPYAQSRKAERDQAVEQLRACLASAERLATSGDTAASVRTYYGCRGDISDALAHASVIRAIIGPQPADADFQKEVATASSLIDEKVAGLLRAPVKTMQDAVSFLALQLGEQGVSKRARFTVAPLTFANTEFSSTFGQSFSESLERAIAAREPKSNAATDDLVLRGVYLKTGDTFDVRVTARRASDGRFVAGAQTALPEKAIPESLPTLPRNFQEALEDQRVLAKGELIDSDLRLEVWTNKGRRNLVFKEREEMQLFMRVNQPAYVRLVYILQSGQKVMLEQSYFIDSGKVNMAVQYPDAFVVSPPFGVEQIHATAFTNKPEPLATAKEIVGGEEYEVVVDGTAGLVRHRGIKKKQKADQVAESTVSVTTTPGT